MMSENNEILLALAKKLAMNCVTVSLGDAPEFKNGNVYETVLKTPLNNKQPERFIVVVGAGASHDAFKKLPLGADAAEDLKKHFIEKQGNGVDLIEEELKRLERVYRLNRKDFESILLAISKFFPQKLKAEISERYSHKFYPSLTYEIIAHLMKHRFVDAVINFNFDELLDQAIEDELGHEEYKKVIAEGDYDESSIMDNPGLKYPIYLKPHGTNSNPSSLRFTREDYFALPSGIASLIKNLLGGAKVIIDNNTVKTPVNLIVIGFNMQSFEFNMLCEEELPPDSKIYFINRKLPEDFNPLLEEGKEKQEERDKLPKMLKENFIKVDDGDNTLDNVLKKLWGKIELFFHGDYKPRGITRHELISHLFKEHKLIEGSHLLGYLKDRVWVELTLSIAKYKGFACFNQLANDRFGKYFILYRQAFDKFVREYPSGNHQNRQDFKDFIKEDPLGNDRNKYPKTIKEFCIGVGLSSLVYGDKTFRFDSLSESSDKLLWSSLTVDEDTFKKYLPVIYKTLCDKVNKETRTLLEGPFTENYADTLLDLFKERDSEVSPKYDISYKNIFLSPKLIKTSLALDYYTQFYFKKKDWTALLVVAETGEWILNKMDELADKKVILVMADDVKEEELRSKIKDGKLLDVHKLNWWLHNQHMTIFLQGIEGNYHPLQAIYFERRHRSTHIHPVIVEDNNDCKLLMETFAAYCQKAENIKSYKEDEKMSSEVERKHIDKFFEKNFKSWGK